MTIECISSQTRRARKEHRCFECGGSIARGTLYLSETLVSDDSPYRLRIHTDCAKASDLHLKVMDWDHVSDGRPPLWDLIASGGGQEDLDYLRGHYPHVVCRIELARQKSRKGMD